jgi:Na+-driven multidrug efflux pump
VRVIAWTLIPFTLNAYFVLTHVAAGSERPALVAVGVGILVGAALGLLWIPRQGVMGACWSMLAAEWAQAGVYLLNWSRARASLRLASSSRAV